MLADLKSCVVYVLLSRNPQSWAELPVVQSIPTLSPQMDIVIL